MATSEGGVINTATASAPRSWKVPHNSSFVTATQEQTQASTIVTSSVFDTTGKGNFTFLVPVATLSGTDLSTPSTTVSLQSEDTHSTNTAGSLGTSSLVPGSIDSSMSEVSSTTTASPRPTLSEATATLSTSKSSPDTSSISQTTLTTNYISSELQYPTPSTTILASTVVDSAGDAGGNDKGDKKEEAQALSTPETVGIAIGSTTCVIIALVAVIFVARRYHAKAAQRKGEEKVYPEVAYLYDPPVPGSRGDGAGGGRRRGDGDGAPPHMMSGPAAGIPTVPRNTPEGSTPPQPGSNTQESGVTPLLAGNPIRDPGSSTQQTPGQSRKRKTKYPLFAVTPYAYNPAAEDYPPMLPYDKPDITFPVSDEPQSAAQARTSGQNQPKPNLLVPVAPFERSCSPEPVDLCIPPPTPDTVRHLDTESLSTFTLPQTVYSPPTYGSSASSAVSNSSTPPTCKGWDNTSFTDYSDDDDKENHTPSSSASSSPKPPVPLKVPMTIARKPVGSVAVSKRAKSTDRSVLSGQGQPMAVKSSAPGKSPEGLGFDFPFLTGDRGYRNQEPEEKFSTNPAVVRKRRSELEFAEPGLVGRERF